MIAYLHNIPFGNVKKFLPSIFFLMKKSMYFIIKKLTTLSEARIEAKKIHCVLEFNQSQRLKPYFEFSTQKSIEAEKMVKKMKKHCTN